jgi:DNA helicase-2/ATP-dependent DNA helicase PcrA
MAATVEQVTIANHEEGHALIGACPGSGKTTTMISLVLNLLLKGVEPEDILALTFGKSSQTDFEKRLKERAPEDVSGLPAVRTFHSLGKILCEALELKGLLPKATLETNQKRLEMTALNLLKSVLGPAKFKEIQGDANKMVEEFLAFVDFIKSGFLTPKEVFELFGFGKEFAFFIPAYDKFEENRKRSNIRYFADLIYDPVIRIMNDERLRNWIGNKKSYILVDEFQDTNAIQFELIKIIAGSKANVIGVGDVDQSIYNWRGSDTELMLTQFAETFKEPTFYTLSRTFRYGHKLAMFANNLIVNNKERADTLCISGRDDVITDIDFHGYRKDCGKEVVEIINQEIAKGRTLSEIAILVRLYSSAAPVELELLRNGINYRLEGGHSCLYSREMRNMEFLLQIATGAAMDLEYETLEKSMMDLLKFPHIGMTTDVIERVSKAVARLVLSGESVSDALLKQKNIPDKGYIQSKLAEHAYLLSEIEQKGRRGAGPGQILDYYVKESKLYKGLEKMALSTMEITERTERCEVFLRYVKGLGSSAQDALDAFVELRDKQFKMEKNAESVVITSIHKSKGLEWKVVIMPGLEGSRFPYAGSNDSALTTIESERRLFYVGMTRAINQLHLLAPRHEMYTKFLQTGEAKIIDLFGERDEPSQFIFELDPVFANKVYQGVKDGVPLSEPMKPEYVRYLEAISQSVAA